MKFLFDFLPVMLFFLAFKVAGIYVATAVAMAASIAQVIWLKARKQRVPAMVWASLVIIVVFGGATLLLQDEMFIKWKPTVLYWVTGVALAASEVLFKKNLVRSFLGEHMDLPARLWQRLNWCWVAFFALMGVANLYVAFHFSTDLWVNFKLFGGMGLMILFFVIQFALLSKYIREEGGEEGH